MQMWPIAPYAVAASVATLAGFGIDYWTLDPLGVAFSYGPPDPSGDYSADDYALVSLINPHVQEAAIYATLIPEPMAADYRATAHYPGDLDLA